MEFIRQLAAFCCQVEEPGGIMSQKPEELEDLWIKVVNAPTESALVDILGAHASIIYAKWTGTYLSGQPAAPPEPVPAPAPDQESLEVAVAEQEEQLARGEELLDKSDEVLAKGDEVLGKTPRKPRAKKGGAGDEQSNQG